LAEEEERIQIGGGFARENQSPNSEISSKNSQFPEAKLGEGKLILH